ncbi:MAG: DUF4974 domain-containing protein [Bacteroidaceae bacterium]|nr:DUF4974 domain-containing protein [Bacteroidaceae bacterium]
MKQKHFPETEQQLRADVNLREALRRRYADEPQLPEDFAQKLQKRILAERATHPHPTIRPRRWRNVAAIVAGVLLMSGVVVAAVRWAGVFEAHADGSVAGDTVAAQQMVAATDGVVQFRNVPLDSLLTVVGTHYQKTVVFVDEEPRTLRFSIEWNEPEPLADFLATVNEFDGLRLTDERDTIFVESVATEEEEDEP